jgi:hypothetical protein
MQSSWDFWDDVFGVREVLVKCCMQEKNRKNVFRGGRYVSFGRNGQQSAKVTIWLQALPNKSRMECEPPAPNVNHNPAGTIRPGLYSDPRIKRQRCARKFLVISFSILAYFFLLRPLPPIQTKSPSQLDRPIDE